MIFVGLPGPPIGPLEVSDITQHTATLAWKPPDYDGGCKITHYLIERKETTHNQWVIAASYCKVLAFLSLTIESACMVLKVMNFLIYHFILF